MEVKDSQAYFWSDEWQAGEAESAAELDAGEGVEFASAAEAIAWLQAEDEPCARDGRVSLDSSSSTSAPREHHDG